ncbi:hypothetical protein Moror_8584 [Moniliophthora roreri MCA 2997]|uniref:Uncharacterized protein n=1 Tax=Moniliophthora roreri (strain MCA 2997) TaxID=1381753 RepID=V2WS73_MONRO|nr:hypothetical protein Moror_8584 [Moniliophthora roreri MCA 2997]
MAGERDPPDLSTILPAGSKCRKPTRRHNDNAASDINSSEEEASQPPCKRTSTSTSHKFTTTATSGDKPSQKKPTPSTTSQPAASAPDPEHQPNPTPPAQNSSLSVSNGATPAIPTINIPDQDTEGDLQHRRLFPGRPASSAVADHPEFARKESHSLSGETTAMLMLYCSILVFEGALKEDYKL